MLDLLEELVAEEVGVILKLVLHLGEGFEVVALEELPLLELKGEVVVEVLKKKVELALEVALQSRKVFALFDPNVAMEGQLVLLLDILRCFFYAL